MSHRLSFGGGALGALLAMSCGSGAGNQSPAVTEADVVRQYALNLKANYQDVVTKLADLQSAVAAFVAAPSRGGFDAARAAWLAARPFYGQCEISRFYGGPLDQVQIRMNEWPIDENFLDYTYGIPDGGIVNQPDVYPVIDVDLLKSTDQMGGQENLPAGFHAIEFLLWGQRPSQSDGPGARPYTDYVDGGTAANQSRRRDYLKAATDLLFSDMQALVADWDLNDPHSYGATMVAGSAHDGVQKIVRGLTDMHVSELYYERMLGPGPVQRHRRLPLPDARRPRAQFRRGNPVARRPSAARERSVSQLAEERPGCGGRVSGVVVAGNSGPLSRLRERVRERAGLARREARGPLDLT